MRREDRVRVGDASLSEAGDLAACESFAWLAFSSDETGVP